jgi:GntR family transcriptional repressor for pyruvate dehydrogenase complex
MPTKVQRLAAPGSLTDRATEALTRLVAGGEYPAGARLPTELELAGRFGVSRTVVREAVARLKSAGLVESRQGSGVFVREPNLEMRFQLDPRTIRGSLAAVLEVVEVRRALESEAAALAAVRHTRAQLAELRAALAGIAREEAAGRDGVRADVALHRAITRASGNRHFPALWDFIGPLLDVAIRATRANEARRADLAAQVRAEHRAIVDAIAHGDAAAARAAALRHMDMAEVRIRAADPEFWAGEGRPGPPPARRRRRKGPPRPRLAGPGHGR